MLTYADAYIELKQGLQYFKNNANSDTQTIKKLDTILAIISNPAQITPATQQLQNVQKGAQTIINNHLEENQNIENQIKNYDNFIKDLKSNQIVLVADKTESTSLKSPLRTVDAGTRNTLQNQEDPNKTYLTLNK